MSITLFLINKKGYLSLKSALMNDKFKQLIKLVVVGKDRGNNEDFYKEITALCKTKSIKVIDRKDFSKTKTQYSIAIGWKWLLFDVPNLIIFHDSLLPKYRGFAPLPNMLINGERVLGVTALFASNQMDEGDIIFQKKTEIQYPIKIKDAIDTVAVLYSKLIIEIMTIISCGNELPHLPQRSSEASYSIWRDNEDYFIDWTLDAVSIQRFVNAVGYPYDGAKIKIGDEVIKINEVKVIENLKFELVHPGKILMFEDKKPIIICGLGAIKIKEAYRLDGSLYQFKKLRNRLK